MLVNFLLFGDALLNTADARCSTLNWSCRTMYSLTRLAKAAKHLQQLKQLGTQDVSAYLLSKLHILVQQPQKLSLRGCTQCHGSSSQSIARIHLSPLHAACGVLDEAGEPWQ